MNTRIIQIMNPEHITNGGTLTQSTSLQPNACREMRDARDAGQMQEIPEYQSPAPTRHRNYFGGVSCWAQHMPIEPGIRPGTQYL